MIAGPQETLASSIEISGVGLHQGTQASLCILPAPADFGFVFKRIDLAGQPEVKLDVANLGNAQRRTQLESGTALVHTTEHVIAALFGLGVDNALIEISGEEPPAMDGSGLEIAKALLAIGNVQQDAERAVVRPRARLRVGDDDAWIEVTPHGAGESGLNIEFTLDYRAPELPPATFTFAWSPQSFFEKIVPARTFCLESEAKMLRAAGFGRGATLKNTLVVGVSGVIDNELRFADEFVRHKVLDLVGDFALLGARLDANVRSWRGGHALNHAIIRKLVHGE